MTLTIPNTISNGTAGDASEVEANFAAIESYVNASVATVTYVDDAIPAGVIWEYGGTAAPAGWLFANGAVVSRATYARLFAALGTTWGVGDGVTTFGLPDRRDRVAVGKGTSFPTLAATGGQTTVQAHTHTNDHDHAGASVSVTVDSNTVDRATRLSSFTAGSYIADGDAAGNGYGDIDGSTGLVLSYETDHAHTASGTVDLPNFTGTTGSTGAGANNMNPYLVVNYIIKLL